MKKKKTLSDEHKRKIGEARSGRKHSMGTLRDDVNIKYSTDKLGNKSVYIKGTKAFGKERIKCFIDDIQQKVFYPLGTNYYNQVIFYEGKY